MQHAAITLFDGSFYRLARHLGVNAGLVRHWLYGQRVSLPMLTTIADCCGCKISDILLGKHVKLQKRHANADSYTVVGHPRGAHRFATSDALVAALQRLDELGSLRSLNQACRLLDMNQNTFRRLAPDVAALLVHCVIEKAPSVVFNEMHGKDELDCA